MIRLFVILILLMVNIKGYVVAEEVKYPPYPEVWGYDISKLFKPENQEQSIKINQSYRMPNGDIWITFYLITGNSLLNSKDYVLKFFEQKVVELNDDSIEKKIIDNSAPEPYSYHSSTTFSDGTKIKVGSDGGGKLCRHDSIRQDFLIKSDKEGKEIGVYSIINAYPNPQELEDDSVASCEYPALISPIYKQLDFFPIELIGLKDDTFFAYNSAGTPLLIRLDKNLNTKFRSEVNYKTRDGRTLKQNFFIIPYSIIDDFLGEAMEEDSQSFEQSLQDKLINYFIEQQDKN